MSSLISLILVLIFCSASALAISTDGLSQEELKAFGHTLEKEALRMQWSQLWKTTRESGAFEAQGNQPRFTVDASKVEDIIRVTLANAQNVEAQFPTFAIYRRDFSPNVVGFVANKKVTAACITVDWRAIPAYATPTETFGMSAVKMLIAQPCE